MTTDMLDREHAFPPGLRLVYVDGKLADKFLERLAGNAAPVSESIGHAVRQWETNPYPPGVGSYGTGTFRMNLGPVAARLRKEQPPFMAVALHHTGHLAGVAVPAHSYRDLGYLYFPRSHLDLPALKVLGAALQMDPQAVEATRAVKVASKREEKVFSKAVTPVDRYRLAERLINDGLRQDYHTAMHAMIEVAEMLPEASRLLVNERAPANSVPYEPDKAKSDEPRIWYPLSPRIIGLTSPRYIERDKYLTKPSARERTGKQLLEEIRDPRNGHGILHHMRAVPASAMHASLTYPHIMAESNVQEPGPNVRYAALVHRAAIDRLAPALGVYKTKQAPDEDITLLANILPRNLAVLDYMASQNSRSSFQDPLMHAAIGNVVRQIKTSTAAEGRKPTDLLSKLAKRYGI